MFHLGLPIWLSLLAIPVMLLLQKIKEIERKKKLLPPSPPRLPILGNLHQLGALPHRSLTQLSAKYGPVLLMKLGRVPGVVISSAEAARHVLKVHDLDCCSRPLLTGTGKLSYNYLDVAFAPYGEYWKEMRKISVLEIFNAKKVQSFRFIREDEVDFLMNSISESLYSETPVDVSEKMYALSIGVFFRMAFGKRYEGDSSDCHKFRELVDEALAVAGGFTAEECFPYIGWIVDRLTGYHAEVERVCHELDTFLDEMINDHLNLEREKKDQHTDIIDMMLKVENDRSNIHQSGCQVKLTKVQIKAILMDIFVGGVDTVSIAMVWAMAELVRNPRVMHKAQKEVRNCVGKKGRVTEADLDQLAYLRMTIKEALRLHPPGPLLIPRESISHIEINGYNIYPKTMIQVNAWAIGRDPKYWKNPEEFIPERFVDSSIDFSGQNFEFIPFGSGRRGCPGMNMGFLMAELVISNLLYCFDWKLPNGMKLDDLDMRESLGVSLTVSKTTPLSLVPVKYL